MRMMRALSIDGPSTARIKTIAVPRVPAGHVRCRVSYVGLCGVDLTLYQGSSVYLQEGLKRYPFVIGHEWSGTVVEVGDGVSAGLIGVRVAGHNFITCGTCPFCRTDRQENCANRSEVGVLGDYPGAASDYFVVPASVLTPIPDELSMIAATLLEPASAAMHALARTNVREDDHVAVLGTGTLGLATALLAAALGATVTVAGVEEQGVRFARTLGVGEVVHPDDLADSGYSVVIEASGAASAIARVPDVVAPGGRIGLVGVAHHPVDNFPAAPLVIKNVRVEAVLSGIHQWDRLVHLVRHAHVDLESLVHKVIQLDDFECAFTELGRPGKSRPKILLDIAGGDAERMEAHAEHQIVAAH